jgi:hypothetical protein
VVSVASSSVAHMFESEMTEPDPSPPVEAGVSVLSTGRLAEMVSSLRRLEADVGDGERVDQIRLLEELKSAAAAVQAQVAAEFAASQEAAQAEAGVPAAEVGQGVAAQVGLARRESPFKARRYLGWAKIVTTELPHTLEALRRGETTEWRAMLVGRETGWLSARHRAQVDAALAGHLGGWGDRRTAAEARKVAVRLDPHGAADRARTAPRDRRVSLRPAPDTMCYLTGLLPVQQGVAVLAALTRQADALRSAGDPRSRGQLMADTLVQRVTGQATAPATPVEVNLVMSDRSLLGADDEPAHLAGYGPVPAPLARRMLREADDTTRIWVRRLFTRPETGQLVAMDSQRRFFDGGLRRFLIARDQYCRTPWCGAPIRHGDHVIPVQDGGPTSADNGQGLCQACNHTKQAPGWRTAPAPAGAAEAVTITTPTGHTYTSRAPDPPGGHTPGSHTPGSHTPIRIECFFREHIPAA